MICSGRLCSSMLLESMVLWGEMLIPMLEGEAEGT
jgi:hypothetical protein